MFDRTDLDLRYRAHLARIEQGNSLSGRVRAEPAAPGRPRVLAAEALSRLSSWLAPAAARRPRFRTTATQPS